MTAAAELTGIMPVSRMCTLLGIPRRTYYNRKSVKIRLVKTRVTPDVVERISDICSERVTYGYRMIWAMLRNEGIHLNPKTVLRIMRENDLTLPERIHRNVKGGKKLFRPTGPDQLRETDLTYIPAINEGMTYLFNVKDVFSKKWTGYFYSRTCNRRDAVSSIEDSVSREFPGGTVPGIVLREDNGSQYTSGYFGKRVKAMGFVQEFIEKSTPEQNGDIKSFHCSLKTDYIWTMEIRDFEEGRKIIENAFSDYNNIRPHSSIEYLPPAVFRERYLNDPEFRSGYDEKLRKRMEKMKTKRETKINSPEYIKEVKEVDR